MKDGEVSERGTYKQLLSHNGEFAQFLRDVFLHDKDENDTEGNIVDITNVENDTNVEKDTESNIVDVTNDQSGNEGNIVDVTNVEKDTDSNIVDAINVENDTEGNIVKDMTIGNGIERDIMKDLRKYNDDSEHLSTHQLFKIFKFILTLPIFLHHTAMESKCDYSQFLFVAQLSRCEHLFCIVEQHFGHLNSGWNLYIVQDCNMLL